MHPAIPLLPELCLIALRGCLAEERGISSALSNLVRRHCCSSGKEGAIPEFCDELNGNHLTAQFVRIEHYLMNLMKQEQLTHCSAAIGRKAGLYFILP